MTNQELSVVWYMLEAIRRAIINKDSDVSQRWAQDSLRELLKHAEDEQKSLKAMKKHTTKKRTK
jgi:hypothetical protein